MLTRLNIRMQCVWRRFPLKSVKPAGYWGYRQPMFGDDGFSNPDWITRRLRALREPLANPDAGAILSLFNFSHQ